MVYSLALLRVEDERLLEAACLEATPRLREFSAQRLASTGHILATWPRNISNMVYGIGLLRYTARPFLCLAAVLAWPTEARHAACEACQERMPDFTAQGVSNVTYALGRLGRKKG